MVRAIPTPEENVPSPSQLEQERSQYVLAQERLQELTPVERLRLQITEGLRDHIVQNGSSTDEPLSIELNWSNLQSAGGSEAIDAILEGSEWRVKDFQQGSGDSDVPNIYWSPTRVTLERAR